MTQYALYLESGPKRRKTMVHVLDLLGCIAQGATTEAALEATPEAIREYLDFLRRHGEPIRTDDEFTTHIAQHVTERGWVGNGDPPSGFPPDFQPVSAEDLTLYLRRLEWIHSGLLQSIAGISTDRMVANPEGGGRPIYRILEHAANAEAVYLRYIVGKVDGLTDALKSVRQDAHSLPDALTAVWQITSARMSALSPSERAQLVPHGQMTWSARRGVRRMLEHGWEHLQEISRRSIITLPQP